MFLRNADKGKHYLLLQVHSQTQLTAALKTKSDANRRGLHLLTTIISLTRRDLTRKHRSTPITPSTGQQQHRRLQQ